MLLRRCGDLGRAEGGHDLRREPVQVFQLDVEWNPSGVTHTTRSLIRIVTRIAGSIDVVPVDAIPQADSVRGGL